MNGVIEREINLKKVLRVGLIGLDTSHVQGFANFVQTFNKENESLQLNITAAYPGGSDDFELSYGRVEQYTNVVRDLDVEIVDSIKLVAQKTDAMLITSVDGRVHLDQFEEVVTIKKPVFIDKPFTTDLHSAKKIFEIASEHGTPVMGCSPLRYDQSLQAALLDSTKGEITGADCFGPMDLQPTQPGLFWYGIHAVEMMYSVLGTGCVKVKATKTKDHEFVVGEWEDGRIGTVRGNRTGNKEFGSVIHRANGTQYSNSTLSEKSSHQYQNENIIEFFQTGKSPIKNEETLEIIRFIEAANESRANGEVVKL